MLKPGDTFERYIIEAPIGQGGMGSVYRAHDERLGRKVALKVISGDATSADAKARLLREARAAAALDHVNAVAVFDVGEHGTQPYIVMELVEGKTLRALVGDASVPVATRVAHLADAARALSFAHRRGVVHRDIKPENIMVKVDGTVKVLDFGIARRVRSDVDPTGHTQTPALATLTIEGAKLGTPVYMAPEQIRGDGLDGQADQFAWGVLSYELLTGRLPWRGGDDAFAAMASILTDSVDRAPLESAGVPVPVQDVLLRTLEKRPSDRFASMDELVLSLDAAARGSVRPLPAKGATEAQTFSTDDVREVMSRAVEKQAEKQKGSKLGFEDLLAVAAEVGVDEGSLRSASRALRKRGEDALADVSDAGAVSAWIRRRRMAFYRHAGVYAIINLAILMLGLVFLSFTPAWIWFVPALAWGIGLAIHGLVALSSNEDDWKEQQDSLRWWNQQRERRHAEKMARASNAGVHPRELARVRRDEKRGRKQRVEALPEAPERIRIADAPEPEDAAEEEAEARAPERRRAP